MMNGHLCCVIKNGKTPFWKRKVIKARTKYSDPDFIWVTIKENENFKRR